MKTSCVTDVPEHVEHDPFEDDVTSEIVSEIELLDDEPYEEVIVIDLRGFTAEELSFN